MTKHSGRLVQGKKSQVLYVVLKRWVLRFCLKDGSELDSRMGGGREFQRVGAAMAKALSPRVRCLDLVVGVRRFASEERRW